MIKLYDRLPFLEFERAECVRINCINELYQDDALFWIQDEDRCYISLLDGNMTIFNKAADLEELLEFIRVISPFSVFSDANTLKGIFGNDFTEANVYAINSTFNTNLKSDEFSSDLVYNIFKKAGLMLPDFESFAVDFCKRLNRGKADCFYIENTAAAFSVKCGRFALINGIASNKKGMGSICLKGLLGLNKGKAVLAVCDDLVKPFYEKNGFCFKYKSGYWVKK